MRIVILGAPFSGKSTLAKKLAQEKNLDIYPTDNIIFRLSKNNDLSANTFENKIEDIIVLDSWIIEGRHISKTAIEHADKIIWLRVSFLTCLIRKIKQSGLRIETLRWFCDQAKNQYFGHLDTNRLSNPTYSHNKKYKMLLKPYKNILDK
jgi:adenylate kinase family enzyme